MKIEIKGMSIESVELKDLEPLQGNLKILTDKNYQKLKKSFQEKGMFVPIFVWRNGGKYKIIDGHGRERLFLNEKTDFYIDGKKTTKIPCLVIEAENLKDAKEKVLLVSSQFQTITQEGFDEFTFDLDELWLTDTTHFDALFSGEIYQKEGLTDDDAVPEPPKIAKSKLGDLYQLGEHRLLCGDSTKIEDMKKLCGKYNFDFVMTSPPYNADMEYIFYNDKLPKDQYISVIQSVLKNCFDFGSENLWVLWNMGCSHHSFWWEQVRIAESVGFEVNRTLIWKKLGITGLPVFSNTRNNPVVKNYHPNFGYEFLFTFRKSDKKGQRKLSEDLMDRKQSDVWEISQIGVETKDRGGHPATFPIQLAVDGIDLFCDDIVFDPFLGSGSTLIACEKTGRKCFGIEIEPIYCDVIISRWMNYSGKEAYRQNSDGTKTSWKDIKDSSSN